MLDRQPQPGRHTRQTVDYLLPEATTMGGTLRADEIAEVLRLLELDSEESRERFQ